MLSVPLHVGIFCFTAVHLSLSFSPVWTRLDCILDQAGWILQGNQPQRTVASGFFPSPPRKELIKHQQHLFKLYFSTLYLHPLLDCVELGNKTTIKHIFPP